MNYYYVPIALKKVDGVITWIYDYENQIVIYTLNEIQAQQEAERMYIVEKENNLVYCPEIVKDFKLSDKDIETLTDSYPKEINILLRSKFRLYDINEKKDYQEDELNPLYYRPQK